MKETAVEWLLNMLDYNQQMLGIKEIIEQAIEIEKQQIIDAHGDKKDYLFSQTGIVKITGEQYYNQTFK
jgi:hypothetical protein